MATVKSWFSKMVGAAQLENMEDLLLSQLKDLYDSEQRLLKALPKLERAASSSQLQAAFRSHWEETRLHKQRLEQAFGWLGVQPEAESCEAMQGLLDDADEVASLEGDPRVKDAALIAAGQRVEHYEIAGYGCARTFAAHLGHIEVVRLLQETLDEERNTDQSLTEIAETFVNLHATHG